MVARRRHLAPSTTLVTRFVLVVLLASVAILLFAREAVACSLPPPLSASEKLQRSTRVFAGKIVAAFPAPKSEIYQFKVHTVWKGPLHETKFLIKRVGVVAENTSCERLVKPLIVGSQYLVYSHRWGDRDGAIAGGVWVLEGASKAIAEMGEGQLPVRGSSAPVPPIVSEARVIEERAARTRVVIGTIAALSVTATGGLVLLSHAFLRRRYATVVGVLRRLDRRRSGGD